MTHPALTTSFENREMFGWTHPVHTLFDDPQKFTFQKIGNKIKVQRFAKTVRDTSKFARTGDWMMEVEAARALWKDLKRDGARQLD